MWLFLLQLEQDAVDFEKEQQRLAQVHRQGWEADIKEKRRLEKMTEAKDALAADIMSRRAAEFARLQVSLSEKSKGPTEYKRNGSNTAAQQTGCLPP